MSVRLTKFTYGWGQMNDHYLLTNFHSQSKKESKDQESIQSSTTLDPGYQWESDFIIGHHKREPRGQPLPSW